MSDSRFVANPVDLDMSRSVFDRSSQHKTSFDSAKLVPIYLDEVLPGDTFTLDTAVVLRMGTPIAPVMDNAYLDIFYFFVPNRIVWDHWEQFCGANDTTFWTQSVEYTIPICNDSASRSIDDLGVYFGLNTAVASCDFCISELPFRGYFKIWNDWFRDENTQAPYLFTIGDASNAGLMNSALQKVNKLHDYFTSCLPAPQKGASVSLPLGTEASVKTKSSDVMTPAAGQVLDDIRFGVDPSLEANTYGVYLGTDFGHVGQLIHSSNLEAPSTDHLGSPINLIADLSTATAATINQLRLAFQVQKLLERDARGGTRYVEMLKAHFGVTSPDARLQRSEYLGGKRINVHTQQVLSTTAPQSETADATLGTTGAYSLTTDKSSGFTKSFTEHGYIIGVACVRTDHTYGQGVNRLFTRQHRFDFYYPALANIGEQPVKTLEIFAMSLTPDDLVFGYQEAWAEYRFKPSIVSSSMNPSETGSLDYWTYADAFSAAPVLNDTFMYETPSNIARTLAAGVTTQQFVADFYFKVKAARPMPVYSVPGLIDHH